MNTPGELKNRIEGYIKKNSLMTKYNFGDVIREFNIIKANV